jgi:hypothetical protein
MQPASFKQRWWRASLCTGLILCAGLLLIGRDTDGQAAAAPPASASAPSFWVEAGQGGTLPAEMSFANAFGRLTVLNAAGPVEMKGHPFFEPVGMNERGCVTCHQPLNAMSVSAETLRERWRLTNGEDPIFSPVDGANNPTLPQTLESSHSLLLNRGLFRISLDWPPKDEAGRTLQPEFSLEIVRDPTGVNINATYGLNSGNPTVSVFRRARPAANLQYLTAPATATKGVSASAGASAVAAEPLVGLNIMSDARHSILTKQAFAAYKDHQEGRNGLSQEQLRKIVAFENQVYAAQSHDPWGGSLTDPGGPSGLGPKALARVPSAGWDFDESEPVFQLFEHWNKPAALADTLTSAQREFRASVARGNELFLTRQFWVRDVAHFNSIALGNPRKATCTACHNAPLTGQHRATGKTVAMDVGTTNVAQTDVSLTLVAQSELPVFKCTCNDRALPHPYLGRVIYTTDPGRALITGKCADIGSFQLGQLRGLAARAPYLTNGAALTLSNLVDFHVRRFDLQLSEREKQDLVNFLSVL